MQRTTVVQSAGATPGLARPIEEIRSEFPGLLDGEARLDGAAGRWSRKR